MSLLTSSKFWHTKLNLRTRICFLSGFFYYLHTAAFTFIAPTIPLALLIFLPDLVLWVNYLLIIPSMIYTLFIFPKWHNQQYGLSAFAVKMIYSWAHAFAIFDALRGKPMGWVPTGSTRAKAPLLLPFKLGLLLWSGGTTLGWIGLAIWRMTTHQPLDFAPMLLSGLLYGAVILQCLWQQDKRISFKLMPTTYYNRLALLLISAKV